MSEVNGLPELHDLENEIESIAMAGFDVHDVTLHRDELGRGWNVSVKSVDLSTREEVGHYFSMDQDSGKATLVNMEVLG